MKTTSHKHSQGVNSSWLVVVSVAVLLFALSLCGCEECLELGEECESSEDCCSGCCYGYRIEGAYCGTRDQCSW